MIEFKRGKKRRFQNTLFNPYKNGISSYDIAYLSSKKVSNTKSFYLQSASQDYLAA